MQVILCVIVIVLVHNLEPLYTQRFFKRNSLLVSRVLAGEFVVFCGNLHFQNISARTPGKKWAVAERILEQGGREMLIT